MWVFVCLFRWIDIIEEHLVHWEMESKRGHDILINGYGISKGKSNLAAGSFGFEMRWTSMIWKEKLILNKGNLKAQLEQ